ncbi:HNH endonuclease [Pacmanvirus A23]|uniref:HNH endonuclease n=1 Tax=Pacmanvirus A23 TaxID=1932881 RepID=UPI000A092B6A|nr:HNH endonuclease [Pacmanvirus A23]SIP86124.1 HNH endonuclease [Pacmanvirus A23]
MAAIYPENHKKYTGVIRTLASGKFQVQVTVNGKLESKNFEIYEDAENYKMVKCTELGYVKNLIIDCGDYYEMELTQGLKTKIDKDCFYLVDEYIWSSRIHKDRNNLYYVITHEKVTDKTLYLHNIIMNFIPNGTHVVDHINRDGLDNRKINLRIVDITTNNINQGIRKDNETGIKGVHYSDKKKSWIAQWSLNGKRYCREYSVKKYGDDGAKQLAVQKRKNIEEQNPVYANALGN